MLRFKSAFVKWTRSGCVTRTELRRMQGKHVRNVVWRLRSSDNHCWFPCRSKPMLPVGALRRDRGRPRGKEVSLRSSDPWSSNFARFFSSLTFVEVIARHNFFFLSVLFIAVSNRCAACCFCGRKGFSFGVGLKPRVAVLDEAETALSE